MGKRGPFTCPAPGCSRTGAMSSIMQHVGSAHPEIKHARAVLYGLVERGEKIGHAAPKNGMSLSKQDTLTAWGRMRWFLSGLAAGLAGVWILVLSSLVK